MAKNIQPVANPQLITIAVDKERSVSGLLQRAPDAQACYVMAHGAGAGMRHSFLEDMAARLAELRISTLRYQFPYLEQGLKRVDSPAVAQATVRAAVQEAFRLSPGLALFAGGKSFGGRMTSQAQGESPLNGVRGLIFLGFPLHPPGRPSTDRADHLAGVKVPMLFLQGSRDEFANLELLEPLVQRLGRHAVLRLFADADHSFHVPKRTGRSDADVRAEIVKTTAEWIATLLNH